MQMHTSPATLLTLVAAMLAAPAVAQQKPADPPSSTISPAPGNLDGANNGIGTAGSLTHDAGTASSKVSPANTNLGSPASKGAEKPIEGDPSQGGAKQ